jgi:hypothetical protein
MRGRDSKSARANAIARNTVALDLALIQTAGSLARRVAVHDRSRDVIWVDALLGDGVRDNEATLRVTAQSDLGVRAVGFGLLDELRHDGAAATAHLSVAGDRSRVVDTLDCDAVGSERFLESGGEGGTNGGTEVLGIVSMSCCWQVDLSAMMGNLRQAQSSRERRSK